jgi:hypothetical protein
MSADNKPIVIPKKHYQSPKLEQHKHFVQITGFSGKLGAIPTQDQGEVA